MKVWVEQPQCVFVPVLILCSYWSWSTPITKGGFWESYEASSSPKKGRTNEHLSISWRFPAREARAPELTSRNQSQGIKPQEIHPTSKGWKSRLLDVFWTKKVILPYHPNHCCIQKKVMWPFFLTCMFYPSIFCSSYISFVYRTFCLQIWKVPSLLWTADRVIFMFDSSPKF